MLQNGAFPGSCKACEFVVCKVKEKLGSDHSKVMNTKYTLNNCCIIINIFKSLTEDHSHLVLVLTFCYNKSI